MTVKSRLRRAEAAAKSGRCEQCGMSPDAPGRIVVVGEGFPCEGSPADPDERCDHCGRLLWCVIRVVYEDARDVGR